MEATGRINLLCEKQTGVSKATGKAWSKREFVVETEKDEGGFVSTLALSTLNDEVIAKLDKCMEGDKVKVAYTIHATARTYVKDGVENVFRGNELRLLDVEVISEGGF